VGDWSRTFTQGKRNPSLGSWSWDFLKENGSPLGGKQRSDRGRVRYEEVFIISYFSHFIFGDGNTITKKKGQSPIFHAARTGDTEPNRTWLQ